MMIFRDRDPGMDGVAVSRDRGDHQTAPLHLLDQGVALGLVANQLLDRFVALAQVSRAGVGPRSELHRLNAFSLDHVQRLFQALVSEQRGEYADLHGWQFTDATIRTYGWAFCERKAGLFRDTIVLRQARNDKDFV